MQLKFCNHCKKVFVGEFLEEKFHKDEKNTDKKNIRVFFHPCKMFSPDVPAKTSVADMQNFKSSPFVSSVVVMSSLVIRASMLLVFTSTA